MLNLVTVMLAGATMLVLALFMSFVLGWANRAFHVEADPRIEKINAALPAANCGGCGYIGCLEYAEAVVKDNAPITLCTVGGDSVAQAIAEIMGVELEEQVRYSPVIHCCSSRDTRLERYEYRGESTCAAANLVTGLQACTYGCLGLGDCFRACRYGAISIQNGLAVVDYEKCVGCAACSRACPRHIISMVPFRVERIAVVACSNRDAGKEVRRVCKVGCIACKACTRVNDNYHMEGNIARLDYDRYDTHSDFDAAIEKCPRNCILPVGTPAGKHPIRDGEKQERYEADFSSSVEETPWRG